jgi:hypothetical protein
MSTRRPPSWSSRPTPPERGRPGMVPAAGCKRSAPSRAPSRGLLHRVASPRFGWMTPRMARRLPTSGTLCLPTARAGAVRRRACPGSNGHRTRGPGRRLLHGRAGRGTCSEAGSTLRSTEAHGVQCVASARSTPTSGSRCGGPPWPEEPDGCGRPAAASRLAGATARTTEL